jgi:hypothetical protein
VANSDLIIYHPEKHSDGSRTHVPRFFVAFGSVKKGQKVGKIEGNLIQGAVTVKGTVRHHPRRWAIEFDVTNPGDYTLEIKETAATDPPQTIPLSVGGYAIGLTYPLSGTTGLYTENLIAYGRASDSDTAYPVRGTITIGANAFNASQMSGPPDNPAWSIQFINLIKGTATLTVVNDNTPPSSVSSTDLSIDNS